jgi:hypothetical protein
VSDQEVAQVELVKTAVRQILGEAPSPLFLQRVDKALDAAANDPRALGPACRRVINMVKLFIDENKAAALEQRLRQLCDLDAPTGAR